MMAYNRKMGRGKKVYAEWLSKFFGIPISAGDAYKEKFFDTTKIHFSGGQPGKYMTITLEVKPDSKNPGKYNGSVMYSIGGRTEKWDELPSLSLEDFNSQSKIFQTPSLQKMKNLMGGSYDFADEIEQFKKSVEEAANKTLAEAEMAHQALFLVKQMKGPEDMKEILSLTDKFMEYPRNTRELAERIFKGLGVAPDFPRY